jgi:hypothetical protein
MQSEADSPMGVTGRYVVLWHRLERERSGQPAQPCEPPREQHCGDHYDWMFEYQGQLLTWASQQFLPADRSGTVTAARLADHRLAYLDYEGPISGDRGAVRRVETGQHRLLCSAPGRYEFTVSGPRCGEIRVYRTCCDWPSDSWAIEFGPTALGRPIRADAS